MKVLRGDGLFDNLAYRRSLSGLGRVFTKAMTKVIFDRDHGTCIYCGENGSQIDHVLPYRFGGPTITANGVVTCRDCNFQKGSRMSLGFITYGFAHLLRSGENMGWVGGVWQSIQAGLDQAVESAILVPAGQHWTFPVTKTRGQPIKDRATYLIKARAAVRRRPKGMPRPRSTALYHSDDQLLQFVASRYVEGGSITGKDLVDHCGLGCRETASKCMDYLVSTGEWREKQIGDRVADSGAYSRSGRPMRRIFPILLIQ